MSAQNKKTNNKQLPSIAAGVGVLTFDGDIGGGVNISSFSRVRGGYNLTIEQRVKNIIGVSLSGTYGKIADSENGKIGGLNFQSEILQIDLNLLFHFDNNLIFERKSAFAPYISAGIGFLKFNPHTDIKNKDGYTYNYWSDGTIRDLPESDPQAATANFIQRDYKYETKLFDSTTNYNRSTFAAPIGAGITFKLSDNWGLNIGATYYFTFTDWMDNKKDGANDSYLFGSASLKYSFGKEKDDNSSVIYKSVDFSKVDKVDSDQDGVTDEDDKCPGTPKGVKVDGKGCPFDEDGDGVPDYRDNEKQTKKGALVDENGVTTSEDVLAQKQMQWDSIATERSQIFNQNPSLKFLQEIDAKTSDKPKNSTSKIPSRLKPADIDNDGIITSLEITNAIDSFFDGDSPFTVEILNELIDYFFEQ